MSYKSEGFIDEDGSTVFDSTNSVGYHSKAYSSYVSHITPLKPVNNDF